MNPAAGLPAGRAIRFVTLDTLDVGQRFLFYADDLLRMGPAVLVGKANGQAKVCFERYGPDEADLTALVYALPIKLGV